MTDAGGGSERSGVEHELKYRLRDARHAQRYAALREIGALRATGRPRRLQVEDRYLDTAEGGLAGAGYAVRLRSVAGTSLVSVKSTGEADSALHRRTEVEAPAGPGMDPRTWPPSAARALVIDHAGDAPLEELLAIRQVRRLRTLADGTNAVELSVDDVEVVRAGRVVGHFLELEIELRQGDPAVLGVVMAALEADRGLVPVTSSKLERALALAAPPETAGAAAPAAAAVPAVPTEPAKDAPKAPKRPKTPKGPKEVLKAPAAGQDETGEEGPPGPLKLVVGKQPGVTTDDLLAEAGRKVLRFHFARMLAKEAGTRSGTEIEDLHGMRVATRRMRAAWRVYGDAFRLGRTKRLRERLREVAGRLGAVRDLDVLIDALRTHAATLQPEQGRALDPMIEAWIADREAARVVLLRTLDAPWYGRFIEDYRTFVTTEGAGVRSPASPVTPHHVRDCAGSRIWLAYEQVRGYEPVLRWADVETLHELRIAAKWLRYTIEFFREAMGPEVDGAIAKVVSLQDHLGWLHDADVSIALTRTFLVARSSTLTLAQSEAISDYLDGRERELERLRRTVGAPWRGVAGLPFRRLLGRVVSTL